MPSRDDEAQFSKQSDSADNFGDDIIGDIDDALWMQINTYADGEATPEEALRMEALLRSNSHLARELSFLKLTAESVSEFAEIDPPVSLLGSIFEATTRKKTWMQRVQVWWVDQKQVLLPNALRIGTATGVLATASILAVIVWPRPVVSRSPVDMAHNANMPAVRTAIARSGTDLANPGPSRIVAPKPNSAPAGRVNTPRTVVRTVVVPSAVPRLSIANLLPKKSNEPLHLAAVSKSDKRSDKAARTRPDMVVSVASNNSATKNPDEMRHMAADANDSSITESPSPSLGPDVDAHVETAMDMSPASDSSEDSTQVTTVSYKPGSISRRLNAAPPTLAMRANETIKREHELEQYGGYTKDAYNNIQRGEVGVSKVVGKF